MTHGRIRFQIVEQKVQLISKRMETIDKEGSIVGMAEKNSTCLLVEFNEEPNSSTELVGSIRIQTHYSIIFKLEHLTQCSIALSVDHAVSFQV